PGGRAVYELVLNTDPDRVPALIEALPADLRADIAALDPSRRDLAHLPQRFFLVHGRDDPIIPETESIRLAAALPAERTRLFLVDSLDHVNPRPIGVGDKLTLLDAIYGVLKIRDGET
ncbi:MAG: alpha/beta hydrolase, partial [Arenibacter algicola]|nr:alpha/beta hydrolase [Arenibacter algicola]